MTEKQRQKRNAYMREYRKSAKNKQYNYEYQQKYRQANKEHIKEINKEWRLKNPDKVKISQIKKQGTGELNTYRMKQKRLCKENANYTCQLCGSKENIHAHHIISINNGGSDELDNLICVCETCHLKLHGKIKH